MAHILSLTLSLLVAILLMLPFGGLCLWMSYRLGRKLHVTGEAAAIVLGVGVFPLPIAIVVEIVFRIVIHLIHPPHDGQYAMSGIFVGGWMGAGAARLENIKKTSTMP